MLLRKYGLLKSGKSKIGWPLFSLGNLFSLTGIVLSRDLNAHPEQIQHLFGIPATDNVVLVLLCLGIGLMVTSFILNFSGAQRSSHKENR